MKKFKDILKELDDVLLVIPNGLTDGSISELPHYPFVKSKVSTLKNPLWEHALHNVAAKLCDLDISNINCDVDNLYHVLKDLEIDDLNEMSKYYLNIDFEAYNYKETDLGHFINNENEIINIDTVCKLLSISVSDNLEAVTNFILAQLIGVQKEDWLLLYEMEVEDYHAEYLLSQLKILI